ncbi:efflux RND transporter periplasmic adaptor subunit [Herbiconiux sp. CPCC 205763]|uniref:Efflux RND transporter periplasmic adaptor subunit n=1 Tax=Herbiconiux aconitum TaxID=2970913 RepID=A0ABT2GLG0_9MICO|nr:efflux RND transporter periplasmic adaptor subunit [Herbiconiux aconitum]MCS5717057.1 efflux RND transporter periplasmic adaptor subunit [Herbiconiux aconitum]
MKLVRIARRIRPRTWLICGLAALLAVGGGTTWLVLSLTATSASASASVDAEGQRIMNVAASLETLEKTVDASGTIAPVVDEDVDFEVAGTVTAVNVTAGSTVTAGDVLATVDTLTVQADLLEAQATLATAQATLSTAEADDDGTDAAAAQIAADESAVAVAQAAADKAAAAVSGATLTAPVSGLVTAVNLTVGDTVTGTGSSGSGVGDGSDSGTSAPFTIVGTDAWQVSLSVGETDVPNVASGDQVELSTDDGTAFFGTVSSVGLLPSTTSGAAAYPVTVTVTGSPEGLHDGVSATAKIVYERRTDVLTVPSGAVTTADDGTTSVTVVDADGGEATKSVAVGETVGNLTEITDGLSEGDLVKVTVFTPTGDGGTGGTGQFPGGGTLPDGFDPSQLPSGGTLPDGFDPSQLGGQLPGGAVNGG